MQTPVTRFGINGDSLGETLHDFRTRHEHLLIPKPPLTALSPDELAEQNRKFPELAQKPILMPRCTGDPGASYLIPSGEIEIKAGVVWCEAQPDDEHAIRYDIPQETFAGCQTHIRYAFYHGRLFLIRAEFRKDDFGKIRQTLIQQYGNASLNASDAKLTWRSASSRMILVQTDEVGQGPSLAIWDEPTEAEIERARTAARKDIAVR